MMQNLNARSLVVGDILEDGSTVTRISRGPGTFHTCYWTDGRENGFVVSDTTTLRVRDAREN